MEPRNSPAYRNQYSNFMRRWRPIIAIATGSMVTIGLPSRTIAADPPQSPNRAAAVSVETFTKAKTRYVHTNKLVVRSGPSDRYYATSTLEKGSRVEVYLETSDGWSGIRPPDGSHNWIPASSAYLLPGGTTAEVIDNETAAWVGSDKNEMSQLQWQTALAKSQIVQVLGEEHQMAEDGTKKLWYRIAPPQGEFRWVRSRSLSDAVVTKEVTPSVPVIASEPTEPAKQLALNAPVKIDAPTASIAKQSSSRRTSSTPQVDKVVPAAFHTERVSSSGEGIVWSNESEVIADVERQIRSEQAAARIGADLPVEGEPIMENYADESEFEESYGSPKLAPISAAKLAKAEALKAKRHKAAAHQIDSFQHWNSLQSTGDKKLRVGPLASVLGLVGLGVVEAERAPVSTQLAHAQHQNKSQPYGSSLNHIGPPGSNRLDRLPRPGRRPQFSTPGEYRESVSTNGLMQPNETVLTKLWNAEQPLFGSSQSTVAMNPYSTPPSVSHSQNPGITDPLPNEWQGIYSRQAAQVASAMNRAYDNPLSEADFATPEIQQAMLELSRVVSRPTELWDLEGLRSKTQHWIELGDTAIVRGEARLLMERLERFESLRTRTLDGISPSSMVASNSMNTQGISNTWLPHSNVDSQSKNPVIPVSAVGSHPQSGVSNAVQFGNANRENSPSGLPQEISQGEASGWLVQVHTTLPGQPEFALTDDAGKVVTYVQSTAALNLRRYLQQPVIIHGVRGYIPALAARQIVAERVVRLK